MAEGDKSLGEERKEWYRDALERAEYQHHKDWLTKRYGPGKPENLKRGTCPWCGNRQAQIAVINWTDPSVFGGKSVGNVGRVNDDYISDITKARVCLTCGRVELTDSKPER